jgi:hypothetical protein
MMIDAWLLRLDYDSCDFDDLRQMPDFEMTMILLCSKLNCVGYSRTPSKIKKHNVPQS